MKGGGGTRLEVEARLALVVVVVRREGKERVGVTKSLNRISSIPKNLDDIPVKKEDQEKQIYKWHAELGVLTNKELMS